MAPSSRYVLIHSKRNTISEDAGSRSGLRSGLLILMLLIFVAVAIGQFLYMASLKWSPIAARFNLVYTDSLLTLFGGIIDSSLFIVLFLLIRSIPRRNITIKVTIPLVFTFFIVTYLGNLTGTGVYYLVTGYFSSLAGASAIGYQFFLIGYFLSPLDNLLMLTFVFIGCVFYRRTYSIAVMS